VRLIFAEPAARDLAAIVDYIARDNPTAAQNVFLGIRRHLDRLTLLPLLGRPGRVEGTRELTVPRLPYLVVYQVSSNAITVVAVLHTARDVAQELRERLG
jgi:toxin ParE1/3/4